MRVAILLAAGSSRRFGRANKLLVRTNGVRLIDRAMLIARAAPVARIVVVTGRDAARVAGAVRGPRVHVVHARNHSQGMGASLAAGFATLRPREREALVLLADMPAVPVTLAARLWRALRPGDHGVRPVRSGRPGHPVLLRMPLDHTPTGDAGAGRGMRLRRVPGPRGCVADADTRMALARVVTKRAVGRWTAARYGVTK